jgi:hypothetical protein
MKFIIIFVLLGLTVLLVECSGYKFNFTCNDFSSELTLKENAKNLKECEKNQLHWKKTF